MVCSNVNYVKKIDVARTNYRPSRFHM